MSIVTLNDRAVRSVTTFGSLNTGNMVFIKKLTASSSSTLDFLNGSSDVVFDSTYKEYVFKFIDIHPATEAYYLAFQGNAAGGSGYDETITSTQFQAYHKEDGSAAGRGYNTGGDQAQATGFQMLNVSGGFDIENSANLSGTLTLFNP